MRFPTKCSLSPNFLSLLAAWTLLFIASSSLSAASFLDAEKLFHTGQYQPCYELCLGEFNREVWNDRWPAMAIRCALVLGKYPEAKDIYERSQKRFSSSLSLKLFARDVYRFTGSPDQGQTEWDAVFEMVRKASWRYSSAADQVQLGRYLLAEGRDARQILELFYDAVRKNNPKYPDVFIASAELAISKHDYALAAQMLETAVSLQPSNPDVHFLTALAFAESDSEKATAALQETLKLNPNYVDAYLLQAERAIDREDYDAAEILLHHVLTINRFHPQAWALHAVIAHLQGHYAGETALLDVATQFWQTNDAVFHMVGKKLSQKYRFAEGADYQRRALQMNPNNQDARFQLAQDLLRLGQDQDGWQMAHEVYAKDNYHVMAYNLVTLHDQLVRYTSFEDDDFVLRMEANEAAIYGQRALDLLHEAKAVLCEKYAVQIPDRVVVEIFPQQKDFAIRTFGMPGGSGYLGVCFGRLITANSPASQGSSPSNWQAVLWHEFCHVVTLEKTKNRMPRWLSEGISVYEERQRQAGWGEQMTPQYREMILGDDLTPVSQLSGAFLRPKSPVHLQFAYYESSLVVEYLIERYGLEILQRILDDLGAGLPINETLQRYTGSIDALDVEFAKYARDRAHSVAPDLDFHREALPAPPTLVSLDILLKKQPNNYWALKQKAQLLVEAEQWSAAKEILERLQQAYPQDPTSGNASIQLAKLYGEIGDVDSQRKMLQAAVDLDADNIGSLQALAELQVAGQDWLALAETCERIIAVNPFLSQPHSFLAKAAEATHRPDLAVLALQAKVQLDPVDPAGNYFALADSLTKAGRTKEAKRQVLKALELAPRYFEAQQLLLSLSSADEESLIESSDPVVEPKPVFGPQR